MKKIILVYKSETGFTRKYAQWIARDTGCDLLEFRKANSAALRGYDIVVFGSRLHAGSLDGLKKFRGICAEAGVKQLVLFATGAAPNAAEDTIAQTWKNNLSRDELAAIPHFYMQAGLNYESMGFIDRTMMKMVSGMLSRKKELSAEEAAFARSIEKSYDISDEKYIQPLVDYLKKA